MRCVRAKLVVVVLCCSRTAKSSTRTFRFDLFTESAPYFPTHYHNSTSTTNKQNLRPYIILASLPYYLRRINKMSPTKKQKRGGDEKAANKKVEGPSNNNNAQGCTGFVARMYVKNDDGKLVLDNRHSCNLCKSRKVTTMCSGCGSFLCFDHDRRAKIAALLESDDEGNRLREEFPVLRLGVPTYYTAAGKVDGKEYGDRYDRAPCLMGLSCFHIAHMSRWKP